MKKIFISTALLTTIISSAWSIRGPMNDFSGSMRGLYPKTKASGLWSNEEYPDSFSNLEKRAIEESQLTLSDLNNPNNVDITKELVPINGESIDEYVKRTVPIFKEELLDNYEIYAEMFDTNMSKEQLQQIDDGFNRPLDRNFMMLIHKKLCHFGPMFNDLYDENDFYEIIAKVTYYLYTTVLNEPSFETELLHPLYSQQQILCNLIKLNNPVIVQQFLERLNPDMKNIARFSKSVVFKNSTNTPPYFFILNRIFNSTLSFQELEQLKEEIFGALKQQEEEEKVFSSFS